MKKTITTLVAVVALVGLVSVSVPKKAESATAIEYGLIAAGLSVAIVYTCNDLTGLRNTELGTAVILEKTPLTRGDIIPGDEDFNGFRPLDTLDPNDPGLEFRAELNCDGLFGR